MSQDKDNLDLPSIKPAEDERSSYQRASRSAAPRQSNFNGILVFVIVIMVLMMGVGGFALYEVQKKLDQSNILLAKGQENIQELEDRLSATGTDVSKTLQILKEQVDTNVSEIDKLWAVSYRQNRPRIQALEANLESKTTELSAKIDPLAGQVAEVTSGFDTMSSDMVQLRQQLLLDNEEMTTQVALVRGQIQDQGTQVEGNRRSILVLTRQMEEAEEAIDVIDRYRAQVNQRLQDLQGQIQGEAAPGTP